ncbi:MAG: hypothetical protein ACI4S1_10540 [Roseburia sp.]
MARYIDREKLLELINEDCKYKNPTNEYTRGCNEVCDWAIKTIKNISTADVVQIIQCKDCAVPHNQWTGCPKLNGLVTPPDFYCSYGERKLKK